MQKLKLAGAATLAMGLTLAYSRAACAADADWYLGLGAGRSASHLDDTRIAEELTSPGFAVTSIDTDSHKNAYKLFGGYQVNRYFATELSYFDLGKFSFYAHTAPAGEVNGTISVHGLAFDVVGLLPFTEQLSAFAKIGAAEAQTRDSFSSTLGAGLGGAPEQWHINGKFGAGLQYLLTAHVGVRAEWERYRINDAVRDHGNVDAWTVSLVFPFGRQAPPPRPVAEVRQPVSPPPPVVVAPPIAQPVAAPPAPRHVTFDADALFTFNSAAVRPEGTHALDEFARELRPAQFEHVRVAGYTDRIGSDAYNQRLSQRRADAVKDYLVNTAGIDAAKITAEGRGKSDPVTKPGQCGTKRSATMIACLQPDRRVEIEVAAIER